MESSDHFCFIFWTRVKKHIASAAVDCRHIVVLPLTARVSFSCAIGSCGCFPVSFQPVLVPWINLRLLFVISRPQTCINTFSIIGDFYLCDGSSSLPDRRGFHPISLIVPPESTTSSVPSSIASWSSRLMLLWNLSIASDRFVCRRVFDHFNRLRPSWLQQSVQHCLLLQHHQPTCRSNLFFFMQTLLFDSAINVQKENEPRDDEMKTGKKSWRKRCKEDPSLHKVPESTNPDQSIPEPKQLAHVDPPTDQRDH